MSEPTQNRTAGQAKKTYPMLGLVYDYITGDEDARVCKDIPDAACRHLPRNFFAYLFANFLSKVADELSSARLVLPWLLGALGAPAAFVGFLVPVREAGVLLPQLAVAAYIRRLPKRKGVWLLGAFLSAVALAWFAVMAASDRAERHWYQRSSRLSTSAASPHCGKRARCGCKRS